MNRPGGGRFPTEEPLRIGLIGLGVISRFYLAALEGHPTAKLAAVCDPRADRLATGPARVARYPDHRALLRDAEVDAVVVNVPNDQHYRVCREALSLGRAVCVEKPLTTDPETARWLVRLATRRGAPLFTSFHRRYNDQVRGLLSRLPRDVPIATVEVRYEERIEEHAGTDRWYLDPERCGGGCVADNGPNAFDLVRLFLGNVEVREATVRRDERGVDRGARILLAPPAADTASPGRPGPSGGPTARVVLDWSYPGERKTVRVRLADGTEYVADLLAGRPEFKGSLWHEYRGVVRAFTALVTGGSPVRGPGGPPSTGTGPDGLATAELVAATYARAAGTPADGTPENGTPENETPENGTPADGTPEGATGSHPTVGSSERTDR